MEMDRLRQMLVVQPGKSEPGTPLQRVQGMDGRDPNLVGKSANISEERNGYKREGGGIFKSRKASAGVSGNLTPDRATNLLGNSRERRDSPMQYLLS